jgi:alpha-keto-acid decarboxylase
MQVHERGSFFASALYATVGFAVPAALGAAHASPGRRAIVLVGDGGFQMTGLEVSTHAARRLGTIVIVFNNGGFSTERVLLEGSFNDIAPWRYDHVGALVDGGVHGTLVTTEAAFEEAWTAAVDDEEHVSVLNVLLAKDDISPGLRALTARLGSQVAECC